ncbi:MAG: MarR family winged helix-turn-helix transcriptional regulator [Acidimicrobiales bacterium]
MRADRRDPLVRAVGEELAELQAAHDDRDRALADYLGVGRTDLRCLDLVVRHGPHTHGQIAGALGLTPGSVTALVDRLQQAGYISRHPDPSHGRRVRVAPTAALIEAIREPIAERIRVGDQQLGSYDLEQLQLIRDFLHRAREGQQHLAQYFRAHSRPR